MEPTISAVVDEHSTFRTDPMGRALRSLAAVMTWTYGGDEAVAEADRLRHMHASLNSVDEQGTKHSALASGPWAWVLHTGTFACTEGSKYVSTTTLTYADTIENHLVATDTARDYLKTIRHVGAPTSLPEPLIPLSNVLASPVGRTQYFCTVGTTPEPVRRTLGLTWSAADERTLRILGWVLARLVPLLPERTRYFPIAYEARKLERDRARLRKVLDLRPCEPSPAPVRRADRGRCTLDSR